MMKFVFSLIALFGLGIGAAEAADAPKPYADVKDPENTLLLKLKDGDVLIQMFPEDAPNHVARIKELVRQGFYDGLKFHRVIDGFTAQTGDPLGNGTGGSGKNLNSADSQFFICFDDSTFLDRQYTVWGQVISGMQAVDKIKRGTGPNGMVYDPDKIISMSVVADLQK